jgi:hypothetical protein
MTDQALFMMPTENSHSFYSETALLKGYTNADVSINPQKVIHPGVIWGMLKSLGTTKDVACGHLVGGAFFFAMRSCKYSKVSGERLCVKNI